MHGLSFYILIERRRSIGAGTVDGHGHPQDDAMPSFFPDSKNSIAGLSNEVSFLSESFVKLAKV